MSLPNDFGRLSEAAQLKILADATRSGASRQPELKMTETVSPEGVRVREWSGDKSAWMNQFKDPGLLQTGFRFKEGMNKGSGAPIDQGSPRWNFLMEKGLL